MAVALIELKGLTVTTAQAERIVELHAALSEYDKRPIQFRQRLRQTPLGGRFGRRRQYSSGQVSLEKMRRYLQ